MIAQRLTEALEAAAAREGASALVSVSIEVIAPGAGAISASLIRKTRTLLFISAELRDGERLIATASSVHKVS